MFACYSSLFELSRIPERPLTLPLEGISEEAAVSNLSTTALIFSGGLLA